MGGKCSFQGAFLRKGKGKKKGLLIDPINKHSAKVNVNRKYLYKCWRSLPQGSG